MKREDQIRQLKELIGQLEEGTAVDAGGIIKVPAETYTSEDRFQQELNLDHSAFVPNRPHHAYRMPAFHNSPARQNPQRCDPNYTA